MLANNQKEFINLFMELEDARDDNKLLYPMADILFLTIAAVLSGAESWNSIIDYGEEKLDFLKQYLPFEAGIPSKTTLMTVMGLINKDAFSIWVTRWGTSLIQNMPGELIAIDGKALRGARKGVGHNSLYLLNAFATKNNLVIGQLAIDDKTNEITAIPELLDNLEIKGTVVSVDAIGCQKKIVNKIIEKEADYFLAVKGNQEALFDDVKFYFEEISPGTLNETLANKKIDFAETLDKGHGRIEIRRCYSTNNITPLKRLHPKWTGLDSICCVESERHIKGIISLDRRYYITSKRTNASTYLGYSRKHWAIENKLHWVLDVQFHEDDSSIRLVNAAENMGTIRKICINLVNSFKTKMKDKRSTRTLRLAAGWNNSVASQILDRLGV